MTTCKEANVHNLAIEGTFDDCQVGLNLRKSENYSLIWHIGHRQGHVRRP